MNKSAKITAAHSGEDFVAAILRHCAGRPEEGPRYSRLAAAMEAALGEGALAPGDRVPTELDLAERLPFGLGTVQKALNLLVESGMLTRRRRMGTFVAAAQRQRLDDLPNFTFLRPDGTIVTSVTTTVLGRARIAGRGRWSEMLGEAEGGFVAFEERLDWIDDKPFCYVTFHAGAEGFPGGAARVADLTISAGAAPLPARARELLGTRGIGLKVEALAAGPDGRPLYLQTLHVPQDYRLILKRVR